MLFDLVEIEMHQVLHLLSCSLGEVTHSIMQSVVSVGNGLLKTTGNKQLHLNSNS